MLGKNVWGFYMKLYVGMVTHNCVKYTRQTIDTFKTKHPYIWVIVDNGSTDGTVKLLDSLAGSPNYVIIRNGANIGVAKAWNQIIRTCLSDPEFKYVFIMNNDLILNEHSLDPLIEFVEAHADYGIVSGINTKEHKVEEGRISDGCCDFSAFLLCRSCIEKVGLFDENFVLAYFEDNDYHERVKRAGVKSCMVWWSPFYHIGSRTITEGGVDHVAAFERNREYFKRKWGFVP